MNKDVMNLKEYSKYEVVKDYLQHGGNKKRCAVKLGITLRHFNRLIHKFKTEEKDGFIHKNKGRRPVNSLSQELTTGIIELYNTKYQGASIAHFKDLLEKYENIYVSYSCLYRLLKSLDILSPYAHKRTKRELIKKKIKAAKTNFPIEELETVVNHVVSIENAHPRVERAKYFGELIQMDASLDKWFGKIKTQLHLAVDNASGKVVGGYFDYQETLHAYYVVFKQILDNYGIPNKFKTDNRTIFNYNRSKNKDESKDVLTQFGYACKTLGVELETTSVSQAKGQIERLNGSFQRRLIFELKLLHIETIEDANKYLLETFIPEYNDKFSIPMKKSESVFIDKPSDTQINYTLAILHSRMFDNGSSIKFKNKYYQAYKRNGELECFMPKTKCLVIEAFDGDLLVTIDEKIYRLKELHKNSEYSETFDIDDIREKPKEKYIPPMTHPWKHASYLAYMNKAHQYHNYT